MNFDDTDRKILDMLQSDSNITNAQLAGEVGISPSSMLERVRRLENAGVIIKYVALVDPEKLGIGTLALVSISLAVHHLDSVDALTKSLNKMDEVLECYHIAGEEDFMLKVAVTNMREYQNFVLNKLSKIPSINRIKTSFVLSTVKSKTKLAVPEIKE
jgi:DNA-binding Lrp family transcriptional regulator